MSLLNLYAARLKGIPQGLKPLLLLRAERPKAKALGYLEAQALGYLEAKALGYLEAKALIPTRKSF
jgi:hypothetical protein